MRCLLHKFSIVWVLISEHLLASVYLNRLPVQIFIVLIKSLATQHREKQGQSSTDVNDLDEPTLIDSHSLPARCLQDAFSQPVVLIANILDDLLLTDAKIYKELRSLGYVKPTWIADVKYCARLGRRAFWLAQVKGGEFFGRDDAVEFDTHFLTYAFAICVPSSCDSHSVGQWIADAALEASLIPKLPNTSRSVYSPAVSPTDNAELVRLPPRTGYLLSVITRHPRTKLMLAETPFSEVFWVHKALPNKFENVGKRFVVVLENPAIEPLFPMLSPEMPVVDNTIAICFAGQWRVNPYATNSIREHMLETLDADVFGVFSLAKSNPNKAEEVAVEEEFHQLFPRVRSMRVHRDIAEAMLHGQLQSSGRLGFYRAFGGEALGRQQLLFYQKQSLCLNLVTDFESKHFFRYSRIVFTRLDMIWVASHPPLRLLTSDIVWMPCSHTPDLTYTQSCDCLFDDKHAVVNRKVAEVYFRRWDHLKRGTAPLIPHAGPHFFLREFFDVFNLTVGFFPALAGVACCQGTWQCGSADSRTCSSDGLWRSSLMRVHARSCAALLASGSRWVPHPGKTPWCLILRNGSSAARKSALRCPAHCPARPPHLLA